VCHHFAPNEGSEGEWVRSDEGYRGRQGEERRGGRKKKERKKEWMLNGECRKGRM
jgi:hypothetical protein